MLKKMTLFAMAVGALIAFAAPATASASPDLFWETGNTPLGNSTANGDTVVFHGTLSSTKGGLKISCNATATAILWNDPTTGAHGEVTSLPLSPDPEGTHGCTVAVNVGGGTYVDVPECHVEGTASKFPWTVTTSETVSGNHHATIDDVFFTNKFTGTGCPDTLEIPQGFEASDTGDVTGEVVGNCIIVTEAGPLKEGSRIDGNLCATGDLRLTTKAEE